MSTVAISNRKGGTGKTTTAVNLAACLAQLGHDTLLLDLDPQANATSSLHIDKDDENGMMALLGKPGSSLDQLSVSTAHDNLSVVPGSSALADIEIKLPNQDNWESTLARKLTGHGHKFVLIDTPPAMGSLTINALAAADGVLVPLQCDYLSLEGLREFATNLDKLRQRVNPNLRLIGLLRTMYDNRTLLARQVAEELERHFGTKVFTTTVPRNVRVAEAPSHGLPLTKYDPGSRGAVAYQQLAREFLGRMP